MANQEHVDLLKSGATEWNRWREQHPDVIPELSEANFRETDLFGIDLTNARLIKSILNGANLKQANLTGAKLAVASCSETDFTEACLAKAVLSESILYRVKLLKANLEQADLTGTNLNDAIIYEANFQRAHLFHTMLGGLDFRSAKGLETTFHYGRSYLDLVSIERSQGEIPEPFLRGVGASDTFVEYVRSLRTRPIDYYTCFISYSGKDQDFAIQLYTDLQSNGVQCWFAPEDLKIGDHYHQRIDESIHFYDKLVLILSKHSIQSAWVEREVVAAREKEDREQRSVLFPIRLDGAVLETTKAWAADVRRRWHIGDFTRWKHHDAYQQSLQRLLRDLKAEQKTAGQ